MSMFKSDYTFEYLEDRNILLMEDLNLGNRSLTNDMDEVLEELQELNPGWNWKTIRITYKDSQGRWDGVQFVGGLVVFFPIDAKEKEKAIAFLEKRGGEFPRIGD
jgi:hypothetical protein